MGNPWTDLVKQTFRSGKKKNAMYSLKDAMIESKKLYKTAASNITGKRKNVLKKRRTARRKGRTSRRR